MTTTAHEDQYTVAPEPFRQPYDTVAILRRNVVDLELALKKQTERAEKAEAELASLRWQEPVATLLLSYDGADFEMYYDNNKLRFEGMSMKLYAAAGAAPAVPSVVFMAHNKTSSILFAARKDADQYAASFGPAAGVSVTECAVIGSQSAPQAPAVPELDPMTRLIVSDPKQPKPTALQAPAVPEFCAVEAQLTLAETEMLNAKAWSAGTQAKRHIDFAMTAICCARALLQSAEVTK